MGGNEKGAVKGGDLLSAPSAPRQALHVQKPVSPPIHLGHRQLLTAQGGRGSDQLPKHIELEVEEPVQVRPARPLSPLRCHFIGHTDVATQLSGVWKAGRPPSLLPPDSLPPPGPVPAGRWGRGLGLEETSPQLWFFSFSNLQENILSPAVELSGIQV